MAADDISHFLMAIGRLDGGRVIEEADENLREVIRQVQHTGKAGSVTVKINVKPNGEFGLELSADLIAKAPQLNFGKSFFYVDPRSGDLTRNAPAAAAGDLLKEKN